LHWFSSVPEPLSYCAAQPICNPSCSTTTHAQLPRACSHPTYVPWRPEPMRPTIPNLRPHPTVARTNPRAIAISSCVPSNPPTRRAVRQHRLCDNIALCAPRALLPNRPAAPLPCAAPASVARRPPLVAGTPPATRTRVAYRTSARVVSPTRCRAAPTQPWSLASTHHASHMYVVFSPLSLAKTVTLFTPLQS
jgi:hypothetical protein